MKSALVCELCGFNLGHDHNNRHQFTLLKHYERYHPSELEHTKALGKDYKEHKEQYGLSIVHDLMLLS